MPRAISPHCLDGKAARACRGWYDADEGDTGVWYEDRYQVGSNVGNTAYVALAFLQYDAILWQRDLSGYCEDTHGLGFRKLYGRDCRFYRGL